MSKIEVVNIKCGGCAKSIESALTKNGFQNVEVDPTCQLVQFEGGDEDLAAQILGKMGYSKVGSREANSLTKKAKSYASCMVGRLK
jgi:copper chaperone CopZ